jgi:hypothetical protein
MGKVIMISLDEIKKIKKDAESELLKIPGVNGLGIGYKEVDDQKTRELSIHVYVDEKKENVPSDEQIPKEIDGIKTDVIERERVAFPHGMDLTQVNTLMGGVAIGRSGGGNRIEVGTIGAIAIDNQTQQRCIISSFHVLAVDNSYKIGDTMSQPAGSPNIVARLSQASLTGNIDAAVASVDNPGNVQCSIMDLGPVKGVSDAGDLLMRNKTRVQKRGITTRVTQGDIRSIDATITVGYDPPIGQRQLSDQILIQRETTSFSEAGDSGSGIIDGDGNIVGLLVGGPPGGDVTYANRIQNVLEAFNISVCTG